MFTLTKAAQNHFRGLLHREQQQNAQQFNLRIEVAHPGTAKANIELYYCPDGEQQASDICVQHDDLLVYVDQAASAALQEAVIDYQIDQLGGKLHIKAPFLKKNLNNDLLLNSDDSLLSKIKNFLDQSINPLLDQHGGFVEIKNFIQEQGLLILNFGGGCKGCSMIDVTLKNTIESKIKTNFPEVLQIIDSTKHTEGTNPYY